MRFGLDVDEQFVHGILEAFEKPSGRDFAGVGINEVFERHGLTDAIAQSPP